MEQNNNTYKENQPTNDNSDFVEVDPTKIHIEKNPSTIITNWLKFVKNILSIKEGGIKYVEVLQDTKEGIIFKGYNVWVLVFSIIIASVGLNINSTAVIIGAMLISPLMGPIKGVGVAVGTNDLDLLKNSLKNWGITVGISLLTSFLYFLITPIDHVTNQLFLRTEPTFLDVIIAFTGGLAGIIAAVKGKNDTVIPGVAIATALMPPLCTAGYGLASAEWSFFFGASYLFLINSLLIAFATIIVVRYLKFPKRKYLNPSVEKKVKNYILFFMVVMLTPSAYMFYKMSKRTIYENHAKTFIVEVVENSTDGKVVTFIGYSSDSTYIDIDISGGYASPDMINFWNKKKKDYNLENTTINVYQGSDISHLENQLKQLQQNGMYNQKFISIISDKDKKIETLSKQIEALKQNQKIKEPIDFNYLLKAFKIDYPEFKSIKINRSFGLNNQQKMDTTYILAVEFKPDTKMDIIQTLKTKISKRFKFELSERANIKQDSIPVIVY
ncbi:MAG TPA: DUF389 domain-containing protein [Crocinitomix sp.]|nr:DUF389 domain-containing protein [Crocinitomix sp.]